MKPICSKVALSIVGLLVCAAASYADDGGISFGGNPKLLNGHPSVSMKSEVVNIDIHKDLISVDCKFVFHNNGPTSTVRVGFPDEGLGAETPYEGEPLPKKNLKATFLTYDSYVNGQKVQTKLVPTNDRSLFWHTKVVTFKGNSDTLVRDTYTLKPGAQVTEENGLYQQTQYILHTAASWHGPIGKGTINLTFAPDAVPQPLKVQSVRNVAGGDLIHLKWSKLLPGAVLYEGPGEPKLDGRTVRFTINDLRPTKADDIHVYYAYRQLNNMP